MRPTRALDGRIPADASPVCLITPPSAFLLDERVFMTLGILRVAGALERHGIVVEMLDLSLKTPKACLRQVS